MHSRQVLHGAERGEAAAILLSPLKSSVINANLPLNGSQFTLFLTDPLQAFCQVVGLFYSKDDIEVQKVADKILSTAFSRWEVIICKSTILDLVWAQVLPDPFLRRLILRFIFCRSVLALSCRQEDSDKYLPICLPELPDFVSPTSEVVQSCVFQLASHFDVSDFFSH